MTQASPEPGPCPRCGAQLSPGADGTGLRCAACRGSFVFAHAVREVLRQLASVSSAIGYRQAARVSPESARGQGAYEPDVRYLMCPRCGRPMTRQNFARRSGVIVDVCPPDGTWFDADEAERVADYLAAVESAGEGGPTSGGRRMAALLGRER